MLGGLKGLASLGAFLKASSKMAPTPTPQTRKKKASSGTVNPEVEVGEVTTPYSNAQLHKKQKSDEAGKAKVGSTSVNKGSKKMNRGHRLLTPSSRAVEPDRALIPCFPLKWPTRASFFGIRIRRVSSRSTPPLTMKSL